MPDTNTTLTRRATGIPGLVRVHDEQEPAVFYGDLSDERKLRQFLADLADANAPGAG